MRKIPDGFKIPYFPRKTYFFKFFDKFLKFELIEYLIHHVMSEIWPNLSEFPSNFQQ